MDTDGRRGPNDLVRNPCPPQQIHWASSERPRLLTEGPATLPSPTPDPVCVEGTKRCHLVPQPGDGHPFSPPAISPGEGGEDEDCRLSNGAYEGDQAEDGAHYGVPGIAALSPVAGCRMAHQRTASGLSVELKIVKVPSGGVGAAAKRAPAGTW